MKKLIKALRENLFQFVLIVFSVVLGLYLSERIEDHKNKNESNDLLAMINSEIAENIKLIKYWAPYHNEIKVGLDSLYNNEDFVKEFIKDKSSLFKKLFSRGTFIDRHPSSDAWEIGKSHPLIVNIGYDKLLILSKIYNQQKATFIPSSEIFELFQTIDVNSNEKAKSNLVIIRGQMNELVAREELLLDYYDEATEILDLKN